MTPLTARLRAALLAGRRAGRDGSGATALRRSDGYEFAELREYALGDDPRRIDWAASARAGALQTRVLYEEYALVLAVALDASASMQLGRRESNYDLAATAAAFWFGCATDDDRCARLGPQPLLLPSVRGRAAAAACARQREPAGATLEPALRLALATLPRGARLLVASDFFELDLLEPLVHACAARFDLTALLVRDPWHAGFPLRGFVRLRDAESGQRARVYVSRRAAGRYERAVAEREERVVRRLRRAGARAGTLDAAAGAPAAFERIFAL